MPGSSHPSMAPAWHAVVRGLPSLHGSAEGEPQRQLPFGDISVARTRSTSLTHARGCRAWRVCLFILLQFGDGLTLELIRVDAFVFNSK
jgi:hypothetical protein